MNILLTGASGFLGEPLSECLDRDSRFVLTRAVRRKESLKNSRDVLIDGLHAGTDWATALNGQDVVVQAAARVHIMKDEVSEPVAEYRKVNVDGTLNLARQAVAAGVRRFVFISSIKVNGEDTPLNSPFTPGDKPAPEDAYGFSKMEAEQGLWDIARDTGMEVVIIRPPLVYGPGVKGNFARMIKLVEKGLLLPLGAIHNKRSLVALDNLVDLIVSCIDHPAAANQIFLAGDGQDLSTTQLLRGIGKAMGKPARLIPVPAGMLMFGAALLGKKGVAQRVLGSLQVDISKARNLLGWEPPISVEEGLRRCFDSENTL
ncbi:SDR family oxidoreductase [Marinobacter sp. SS13-12]|uniref:UDP-glucose 4-epimerase family protein n=1 Tax=Marinobacter sp. SS13-12 TaxID=3050451 RepID=UPI002556AECE|nr:SDR family oxidoreductase [Marinobacter sp. SS13-12]MDK8463859.1 SDR family oxidoreductase [Marinobacter sp. SS13-12]